MKKIAGLWRPEQPGIQRYAPGVCAGGLWPDSLRRPRNRILALNFQTGVIYRLSTPYIAWTTFLAPTGASDWNGIAQLDSRNIWIVSRDSGITRYSIPPFASWNAGPSLPAGANFYYNLTSIGDTLFAISRIAANLYKLSPPYTAWQLVSTAPASQMQCLFSDYNTTIYTASSDTDRFYGTVSPWTTWSTYNVIASIGANMWMDGDCANQYRFVCQSSTSGLVYYSQFPYTSWTVMPNIGTSVYGVAVIGSRIWAIPTSLSWASQYSDPPYVAWSAGPTIGGFTGDIRSACSGN